MPKQQHPNLGFFYLHLCDIDQHDFEERGKLLEKHITDNFATCEVTREVQYFTAQKPMDSTTQTIIENMKAAVLGGGLTPVVLVDETLANAYEFIGRLQFGAVIIYNGTSIDKESLMNFSSKYLDLGSSYKHGGSFKGHETIQIVPSDLFAFDVHTSLTKTSINHRFAPSKLLSIESQLIMNGSKVKLLEGLELGVNKTTKDPKSKKPFDLAEVLPLISVFDTTLSKNDALAVIKRNKSKNKKTQLNSQFTF